ncbi:hypothetical protein Scep_007193 [Stephania cephalantha]|uniref:Uncharacterized protein n=1 Tax=Stephania cephalantha TaxID=152367 RepID=A0AAP0PPS2_9MAGN
MLGIEIPFSQFLVAGAKNHVAKDRRAFVEFRRIPMRAQWIYVGNNALVAV